MKGSKNNTGIRVATLLLAAIAMLTAGWFLEKSHLGDPHADVARELEQLRISEVQNNNVNTLPGFGEPLPGWLELENTGEAPVDLNNVILASDSAIKKMLVFPHMTLEGGGRLVIVADGSAQPGDAAGLHAPFRLPSEGGNTLYLMRPDQSVLDSVKLPCIPDDASLCRVSESGWEESWKPTPGEENVIERLADEAVQEATAGAIVFSEVMTANRASFPDENGAYPDYVELQNASGSDVDLGGWWLSDDPINLKKWQLPAVILPAGGFFCIHCSGQDVREDISHLHASFRLAKSGAEVLLTDPNGQLRDHVKVPELAAGQAYSREADGDWTSSLPPTPGRQNTIDAAEADSALTAQQKQGVFISEVLALPESGYDWLELQNGGSSSVDLSGYGLSDDPGRPRRWQFPQGTVIAPGGYLGVLLTGDASADTGSYLSADFALSGDGGYSVCLSDASGVLLDTMFLPEQLPGVSFGRNSEGVCCFFAEATPLAANALQTLKGRAAIPGYSVPGGLYHAGDSFQVSLTVPDDARCYYTLDCTDPSEASQLYTGTPIPVSGTTILRTRVYRDGWLPSVMDTQSYLYDVNAAGQVPYVLSLVSDPPGLFSDETGIMVEGPNATEKFPHGDYGKGANYWMDWEREAHVELFAQDGQTALSQECGIKIHGRNTRAYELKSFKVKARRSYGAKWFEYPLFHDLPWDEYEAFVLRYSGQDYRNTFMRDAVLTSLAGDTSVLYAEAEECICYLNGEYYTAMYIRENISPFSICRHEGWEGDEDAIDLVKARQTVLQGSNASYERLCTYLNEHDNTTEEAYQAIDSVVDIDNFIEYISLQLVLGTPDTVNIKRYRDPEQDGKWRWVLYDVDRAMREDIDTFDLLSQGTNRELFKAVMANPRLRERFLTRFDQLLATTLSSQNMLEKVEAQRDRLLPILPDYLANLGLTQDRYRGAYRSLVNCIGARPMQVLKRLQNYMGLSDQEMLDLFPQALAAIQAYNSRP